MNQVMSLEHCNIIESLSGLLMRCMCQCQRSIGRLEPEVSGSTTMATAEMKVHHQQDNIVEMIRH
jgi:hypothetical protein